MSSVRQLRLSVTLVDQEDHVGWKSWKLILLHGQLGLAQHLRTQGLENFQGTLYRAHRAVIFVVAQLSCFLLNCQCIMHFIVKNYVWTGNGTEDLIDSLGLIM